MTEPEHVITTGPDPDASAHRVRSRLNYRWVCKCGDWEGGLTEREADRQGIKHVIKAYKDPTPRSGVIPAYKRTR